MSRSRDQGYIILALALALASSSARAQSPAYAASAAASGDTITIDPALAGVIVAASSRGLPPAPLLAKVREGRLKRAATSRIRNALAALVTRLDSARAALGPAASADELIAGADALAAGADASAVRAVRAALLGQSASAPLGALAQLVASGVPGAKAASMVVELLRKRASPAQVLVFGNLVESDVASGLPAQESATLRLHSVEAGLGDATVLDAVPSTPGNLSGSAVVPRQGPPTTKTPKRRP